MDLYRADYRFQPAELVEDYESLVWADRWQDAGDFRLTLRENYLVTENLKNYKYLLNSESSSVMMIENVEYKRQDVDGDMLVEISGRSIEAALLQRSNQGWSVKEPEPFTGSPRSIARFLVYKYCIDPALAGAVNAIPELGVGADPGGSVINVVLERGPIYDQVRKLAVAYGFGWGISRNGVPPKPLQFYTRTALDRSTGGLYMEYSPDNENLRLVSSMETITGYKNHARVLGAKAGTDVYAAGTDPLVSGLNRRTLVVEARDIGSDTQNPTTVEQDIVALKARGLRELNEYNNRYLHMIDGEIPQIDWNKVFYGLGDIVWVKDTYGAKSRMQITERIFNADATGVKVTPTFTLYEPPTGL